MKRIGILGGTFNPIHYSHLLLAQAAFNEFCLDKVLIMPSNNPPHKKNSDIADDIDREIMIKLAIRDFPNLEYSDFELRREGTTYTSDTLELLNKEYPDTKFYFIVGGDSLSAFSTWHEPESILHRAALVAAGRADSSRELIQKQIEELRTKYSSDSFIPEIYFLTAPMMDISSTSIRKYISYGMSVKGLVPAFEEDFIISRGIYRNSRYEAIRAELAGLLKPSRYTHVLNVAQTAVKLAEAHGEDTDKAYLSGLLHDCAKYLSDEDMLNTAVNLGLNPDEVERRAIQLLHSKVGAEFASAKYGVEDSDIINAVRFHTTGRPGMSRLEKIIYISDYIEPGRSFDTGYLDLLRSVAVSNLDKTLCMILKSVYEYLLSSNSECISSLTLDALNYYTQQ